MCVDQIGLNRPNWTKLDRIDRSALNGPYGPDWTKWTKQD